MPTQLRGAHPFVVATRAAAAGLKAEEDGRIRIGPDAGVVHMVLSRTVLRRALFVVQGLLREAARREWDIVSHPGTGYGQHAGIAIEVRGHRYPLEVHELTETIPFTEAEITAWRTERTWSIERRAGRMPPAQRKRRQATGRLRLLLPNGYSGGRASWAEGARGPLESKLASVFRTLEERASADDARAIEWTRLAEERRREQGAQEARARRVRIENARVDRLLKEVSARRRSADVRAYVAAVEETLPSLEGERARIAAWCTWARDWADRSDPTRQTALIVGIDDERDQQHYRRP